jgi:molecular chaperone GrpE (heat shock protein)
MNDTPRTDAIAHRGYNESAYISEMTGLSRQLERENQTFRAAQKACEDCDAPRVDRIAELERELAVWKHEAKRLEAELETFDEQAIVWWCEYQDLKAKARES